MAAAFLLAAVTTGLVGATTFRFTAPQLALRLWPWDPVSRAVLSDVALQKSGDPDLRTAAVEASASLRRQAINPLALRILGLSQLAQGRARVGEAAMLASARQSRRDLGTRLWMIERAIGRNDVPGTLREYDLALRAVPSSRALLFPVLTQALADPEFVPPVRDLFETGPNWLDDYLVYAVPTGIASENLSAVLAQTGGLPADRRFYHTVGLVDQLVREGRFAPAATLYQTVTRRPAPRTSIDSAFDSMNAVPPFDWRIEPADTVDVSVDGTGALVVSGTVNRPALALTRVLTLEPGAYTLATRASKSGSFQARWSLDCRGANLALATLAIPQATGDVATSVTIPPVAACPAQTLALVIDPSDTSDPVTVTVASVQVRRR